MIRESGTGVPYFAAYGPALATVADHAVADDADVRNPVSVVERIQPYGFHADVVSTAGTWWLPFAHPHSVTPLGSGVTLSWPL